MSRVDVVFQFCLSSGQHCCKQCAELRSLYGRGVAKMHKNKAVESEADIAEAVKIAPHIAAPFGARGLGP